ncbi:HvfC/BufC N-terminal domain-containing protein [Aurantivibrio plasticivorans]
MLLNSVTLEMRQRELVEKILTRFEPSIASRMLDRQGLSVYQNNLLFTATRALSICYPVVEQLVGEQVMYALANMLLQQSPPATGDWADWGEGLASVLASSSLAQSYPFLEDVAVLEWMVHQSGRQFVEPISMADLDKLQAEGFMNALLELPSSVYLLESEYPVDAIRKIHLIEFSSEEERAQEFQRLITGEQSVQRLLVYQSNLKPEVVRLFDEDFYWMKSIEGRMSVNELLDQHPTFDFVQWFSRAVHENWVRITFNP